MRSNDYVDEKADELKEVLGEIELSVTTEGYTLSDAIREGCQVTGQKVGGWASESQNLVCALGAAIISAKARGLIG